MTRRKPPPPAPPAGGDMDALADWAVGHALLVVGTVRDDSPDATARLLTGLGPDHARALVVALAAMVDPDRTPDELLGWVRTPPRPTRPRVARGPSDVWLAPVAVDEGWTLEDLRAAHAAYVRGERDPRTVTGQRLYDRARVRSRRSRRRDGAAA